MRDFNQEEDWSSNLNYSLDLMTLEITILTSSIQIGLPV